VIERVSGVSG